MDSDDRIQEHIEREAEAIFQRWKEGNRSMEAAIERFMTGGRAEHAAKIMERSDRMRVVDGGRVEIMEDSPAQQSRPGDSEEIRLLREQNELLKKLLAKDGIK